MAAALLKRDSGTGVFLRTLRTFQEHLFYGTAPVAASKFRLIRHYRLTVNRNRVVQ